MSKLSSAIQVNPQDLYVSSTVAQADLGAVAYSSDGRQFRYALAGASNLVAGTLLQSAAEVTGNQNLTAVAGSVGDTTISASSTVTVTANQLVGGYAVISVTPGIGNMYRISGHAAYTAAAPTLNLEDALRVAPTTSTRIDLVANPYGGVIINPTTATSTPIGAAIWALPTATYGWIQSAGIAALLADGAITVGTNVIASNATAGAVEPGADAADLQASIGIAVTGIATTEVGTVKLFPL